MNRFTFTSLLAAGVLTFALAPPASASVWNHKTELKFSQPIELPGKILPAGEYVFKLMDSEADRHVVQVWTKGETKLIGTFLTVPRKRGEVADETVVRFKERPGNSPEALKTWFFPGTLIGEEFVYPHQRAAELAKANKQPVFGTRSDMTRYMDKQMNDENDRDAAEMRKAPVKAVRPEGDEIEIIEFYRIYKVPPHK